MPRNIYTVERGREFTINGEDSRPQGGTEIIGIKEHETYITYDSTYTFTADRDRHFEVVWDCGTHNYLVIMRAGCIKGDGTSVSFNGNFNEIFDTQYEQITGTNAITIEAENFKTVDDNYVGIWRNGSLVTNDSTYTFTPDSDIQEDINIDIVWKCTPSPEDKVIIPLRAVWNYRENPPSGVPNYDEIIGTRDYEAYKGQSFIVDASEFYSISALGSLSTNIPGVDIVSIGEGKYRVYVPENSTSGILTLSFTRYTIKIYAGCVEADKYDHIYSVIAWAGDEPEGYTSIYGNRTYVIEKGKTLTINPNEFHQVNDLYRGFFNHTGIPTYGDISYIAKDGNPYIYNPAEYPFFSSSDFTIKVAMIWACNPPATRTTIIHMGCLNVDELDLIRNDMGFLSTFEGTYKEDYGTHVYKVEDGDVITLDLSTFGIPMDRYRGHVLLGHDRIILHSSTVVVKKDAEFYFVWQCE